MSTKWNFNILKYYNVKEKIKEEDDEDFELKSSKSKSSKKLPKFSSSVATKEDSYTDVDILYEKRDDGKFVR